MDCCFAGSNFNSFLSNYLSMFYLFYCVFKVFVTWYELQSQVLSLLHSPLNYMDVYCVINQV